jgi:hypothetical protein
MTAILEAPSAQILAFHAARRGDTLHLGFDLEHPLHVTLSLRCPESGWAWEEDLGLVLPGDERAQVRLRGWPQEASLLQVRIVGGPWRGVREWAGWVSLPAQVGAYLCS